MICNVDPLMSVGLGRAHRARPRASVQESQGSRYWAALVCRTGCYWAVSYKASSEMHEGRVPWGAARQPCVAPVFATFDLYLGVESVVYTFYFSLALVLMLSVGMVPVSISVNP